MWRKRARVGGVMGGRFFTEYGEGTDAGDAFRKAVEQAQYDYGHSGYTGTIAEKTKFIMVEMPEGQDEEDFAWAILRGDIIEGTVTAKDGPAGCVDLGDGDFLFLGNASF